MLKESLGLGLLGFVLVSSSACASEERSLPRSDTDIVYASGFFSPEPVENGPAPRWMGSRGLVRLKNLHRDMILEIRGRAPVQLANPPTISLEFNGERLDEIVGTEEVAKSYEIPVTKQGSQESSNLRISTTGTVVPRELDPGSRDQRRLGFSLYTLTWEPK